MDVTHNSYSLPTFPMNDRASQDWSRVSARLERLHDNFMSQWRQALSAIVPASVEINAVSIDCTAYSQFVKDAPALCDIQVYEIESMQSLCAWCLDTGFVAGAVDSMFGGTGRTMASEAQRRSRSPIETGIRRRLLESLATAYESVWQAVHPIRLNALRQETMLSSLRLTASNEYVVHARFQVTLGRLEFGLVLCLPLRALDILQPGTPTAKLEPALHEPGPQTVQHAPVLPGRLHETPVEVVAMVGELQLTVAQLMSLSIGQVLPFQMNEHVSLQVDGVRVMSGRSGTRNGRHAVKVDLSTPINLHGLKADFTPLEQGLRAMSDSQADGKIIQTQPTETVIDDAPRASLTDLDHPSHESEQSQ